MSRQIYNTKNISGQNIWPKTLHQIVQFFDKTPNSKTMNRDGQNMSMSLQQTRT